MVTNKKEQTQTNIESNFTKPLSIILHENSTFKEIFGDIEEWIFEEGIFRFMLNPVNRRWLFWDRYHGDWKDTGYYAGEVTFAWDGEKLLTPKKSTIKADPAHEALVKMVSVDGSDQEYPVLAKTLIGSERNSDIKIEDTDSKALVLQHAGGHSFVCIGNKDAILVNNNAVPPEGVLLQDGDRITIGKTQFDFVQISLSDSKRTEKMQTASAPEPTQKSPTQANRAKCHNCSAELEENQNFCTSCGAKAIDRPITPTSTGCGDEISEGLKFCTNCGQKF